MLTRFSDTMVFSVGPFWIVGTSKKGIVHEKEGKVCQDALSASFTTFQGHPLLVLSVADGHGAEEHRRSDVGARLAVETAHLEAFDLHQGLIRIIENQKDPAYDAVYDAVFLAFRSYLIRLVHRWKQRIQELEKKDELSERDLRAYGCTLGLVVIFQEWIMAASLGDSSVHVLKQDPLSESATPFPAYMEISSSFEMSGITDSLIDPAVSLRWSIFVDVGSPENKLLMLALTTDGVTRSIENFAEWMMFAHEIVRQGGLFAFIPSFPHFLERWSQMGAGDDTTMLCVFSLPSPTHHETQTREVRS